MIRQSSLDILSKFSNDVALRVVLANVVTCLPEAGSENAVAHLQCTSDLCCGFPHHLSEMGWLRVAGIILRDFIRPRLDSRGNVVATTSTSSQVLSVRAKRSPRMHELAAVCPLLSRIRQSIIPSQSCSTMLCADGVVRR